MKSYFLIIVSSKLSLLPLFFIILRFLSSMRTEGNSMQPERTKSYRLLALD